MKRISKFRFWNFIVGRMSQVYTLEQLHDEEVNLKNLIELQFTGQTDKNGTKIFEGDIVTYKRSVGNWTGQTMTTTHKIKKTLGVRI